MKIRIKIQYLVIALILLILVVGIIWSWPRNVNEVAKESCDKEYEWVNPNIVCRDFTISKVEYAVFKNKLIDKIEVMKKEGKVEEVAVYFRDLEAGPTFGINDRMNFIPASLLKLPVMLTLFKLEEEESGLLEKKLTYSGQSEGTLVQYFSPEKSLELGKSYTIDDLIFRMIAYSDNRSYFTLTDYLKKVSPDINLISETYQELGMVIDNADVSADDLSVKTYASIFRILYNISYLSDELSEKALSYLGHSDFEDGLVRNLPENIPIAHKFGERSISDDNKQLHDCGIIYYPGNPYSLCIMTRGKNLEYLNDVIGAISQEVYQEVDSRRQ